MQSHRDAWIEINLGLLEENAKLIRKRIPRDVDLMAIVKADGYGHGAAMIIPTLEASGVSMVGVASMDEALHLRQSGLRMPILVIGGIPDWAAQYAAEQDIQLTIFNTQHLSSLYQAYLQTKKRFKVHIKVDTGMHRIGVAWENASDFIRQCQQLDFLQVVGMFSHLADSHDPECSRIQLERWQSVCDGMETLPPYVHIANSGYALLSDSWPLKYTMNNLARLGIAFYGYGCPPGCDLPLLPIMSVKGRIMHIQEVPPITGISYSHRYYTPPDRISRIATIPIGYADGVPWRLSGKIEALLSGHRIPQVGRITMDQMMFDISTVPNAMIGDTLVLIGKEPAGEEFITLDTWAEKAETIVYELMCGLRVRLPKTYTR